MTDAILAGERHPKLGRAMHFHIAGRRYPYGNMHYVAVAGGNAFYEKRKPGAPETPAAATLMAIAAVPFAEPEGTAAILSEPAKDICTVPRTGPRRQG